MIVERASFPPPPRARTLRLGLGTVMTDAELYEYGTTHGAEMVAAAWRFYYAHPDLGWLWSLQVPTGVPQSLAAAKLYPRFTDVVAALLPYVSSTPRDTTIVPAAPSALTEMIGAGVPGYKEPAPGSAEWWRWFESVGARAPATTGATVTPTAPTPAAPTPTAGAPTQPAETAPAGGVDVFGWFQQTAVAGIPNWILAGAAAGLAVVLLKGGRG